MRRFFLVSFLLFYSWMTAAVTAELSSSLLLHFRPDGGSSIAASADDARPHFREAQKQVFAGNLRSLVAIAHIDVSCFVAEQLEHKVTTTSHTDLNAGRAPPSHRT